ncbi:hypothetical protein D3C72_2480180 [compost metagenome]
MHVAGGNHPLVGDLAWLLCDGGGLLRAQLPLHQRRHQGRADGVGALDTQVQGLRQGR